jgi:hypothetical protein
MYLRTVLRPVTVFAPHTGVPAAFRTNFLRRSTNQYSRISRTLTTLSHIHSSLASHIVFEHTVSNMDNAHARNMKTELTEPNDLHEQDEAPIIDAMSSSMDNRTSTGPETETRKVPSEALKKIKARRKMIRQLQR